ncbi:MAG: hypothetical protein WC333_00240 [Dehalococcoidia bacterium]|jgi:hypothetical protein
MNTASKIKKNFFNSEKERDIWVKINAELVQYRNKMINLEKPMGGVDIRHSCMWVSNNQLTYDELECDKPRFSLEEFLTLTIPQLFELAEKRQDEEMLEIFNKCEAQRLREEEEKKKNKNLK